MAGFTEGNGIQNPNPSLLINQSHRSSPDDKQTHEGVKTDDDSKEQQSQTQNKRNGNTANLQPLQETIISHKNIHIAKFQPLEGIKHENALTTDSYAGSKCEIPSTSAGFSTPTQPFQVSEPSKKYGKNSLRKRSLKNNEIPLIDVESYVPSPNKRLNSSSTDVNFHNNNPISQPPHSEGEASDSRRDEKHQYIFERAKTPIRKEGCESNFGLSKETSSGKRRLQKKTESKHEKTGNKQDLNLALFQAAQDLAMMHCKFSGSKDAYENHVWVEFLSLISKHNVSIESVISS